MRTLLAIGVLLALPAVAHARCQLGVVSSDFEVDLGGWTAISASVFEQRSPGGNPGGYLYFDNTETVVAQIVAPSGFEGDLRPCDGGQFSFDGRMLGTGGSGYQGPGVDYGHLRITGSAGTMAVDLVPGLPPANQPPTTHWATYSVPFTAASFGVSQTQFENILANVTEVRLGVEALFGAEIQGIDNVRLQGAAPVPSLADRGMLLLVLGLTVVATTMLRTRIRAFLP